ncbi:MAG: hypothetical protein ACK5NY_10375 [Burkholderiaceae bacterium]|jgi:hypothetical protein
MTSTSVQEKKSLLHYVHTLILDGDAEMAESCVLDSRCTPNEKAALIQHVRCAGLIKYANDLANDGREEQALELIDTLQGRTEHKRSLAASIFSGLQSPQQLFEKTRFFCNTQAFTWNDSPHNVT